MALPYVYWFDNTSQGAPNLNGETAGLLLGIIDLLVNGCGLKTVDSLSYSSGTGLVTATVSTGHVYKAGQAVVVACSSSAEAAYNSVFKVIATTTTTFTYQPASAPSTASVSTGITAKLSPPVLQDGSPAWFKYSATNKGAFRSLASDATKLWFAADDSVVQTLDNRRLIPVSFYESMTDAVTGTGFVDSKWFLKSSNPGSASNLQWGLFADDRFFYLFINSTQTNPYHLTWFGDFVSIRPGDAFNCCWQALPNNSGTSGYFCTSSAATVGQNANKTIARGFHQFPGAVSYTIQGSSLQNSQFGNGGLPLPNYADNSIYILDKVPIVETSNGIRGFMPGLLVPLHSTPFPSMVPIAGLGSLSGKLLMPIYSSYYYANTPGTGQFMIDLTGPWR
jgi:hypothetical protein